MNRFAALFLTLLLLIPYSVTAEDDGMWRALAIGARSTSLDRANSVQAYRLDAARMTQRLATAPMEGQLPSGSVIELPVNTRLQRFRLEESPIMEDGLATRYPDIKTYKVQGIDNPYASGRLSMTPRGFHGMITSPAGTYYIDPQNGDDYVAYKRQQRNPDRTFSCGVAGHTHSTPAGRSFAARTSLRVPGSLQVYRLAVAATAEYVALVGPSVDDAQAEIVIAINRVNQIYERDLGIRLLLVDNNQRISFTNPDTDPYTNPATDPDPTASINDLLLENQQTLDNRIGTDNYDIGHVFSTAQGGVAFVGAVCDSGFKAGGVTGLSAPVGEEFYIDYVAHEIGHQFGADHSFNGTNAACGPGRNQATAFEPGSGSTIMSYSGLCGAEDLQNNSDALFHAGSIEQIDIYTSSGQGASCGGSATITNNPSLPTADTGTDDYVIPIGTPFALTGSGSDADADMLSYTWDQMDAGTATNSGTLGIDLTDNALMRSRLPQAQPRRDFPRLYTQLYGIDDFAEVLPSTSRQLNFRFGVRDGKSGIAWDDVTITTADPADGEFAVTSHSAGGTHAAGSVQTVLWDVADTNNMPVDCPRVDIDLLMLNAGSSSYCVEPLRTSVLNDGSAPVTLPDLNVPKARFRVSCANNIFYAISSADLEINLGSGNADTSCQSVVPELELHESENITSGRTRFISASSSGGGGLMDTLTLLILLLLVCLRIMKISIRSTAQVCTTVRNNSMH